MDKKLFEQRLNELAEWRYLKSDTPVSGSKRSRGRKKIKPDPEEDIDDSSDSEQPNQTLSIQVTKMHCQAQVCDDCGRDCPQGRRIEQKVYDHTNYPHWRKRCDACGMTKNPYTGKFDLKGYETHAVWTKYTRGKNSPKKAKNQDLCQIETTDPTIHYEDAEIIIRFPSRTNESA